MNLRAQLEKAKVKTTMASWIKSLPDEDREAVHEAIASGEVSLAKIHRIVTDNYEPPCPVGITSFKEYARKVRNES